MVAAAGIDVRTKVTVKTSPRKVKGRIAAGSFKSLGQAAGVHRKVTQNVIGKGPKPRPVGQPVNSPKHLLRKSVLYALDKAHANYVLGYAASVVDDLGRLHEKGGRRGDDVYGPRPAIGPGLEKIRPRLNRFWKGMLKG